MIYVVKGGIKIGVKDEALVEAYLTSGWTKYEAPKPAEKPAEPKVRTTTKPVAKKSPGRPKKEQ